MTREESKGEEHRVRHPLGRVPVLEEGFVFESAAICLHLADLHPHAGLAPAPGTHERCSRRAGCVYSTVDAMTDRRALERRLRNVIPETQPDPRGPAGIRKGPRRGMRKVCEIFTCGQARLAPAHRRAPGMAGRLPSARRTARLCSRQRPPGRQRRPGNRRAHRRVTPKCLIDLISAASRATCRADHSQTDVSTRRQR
jgi:glutathione S-transferase